MHVMHWPAKGDAFCGSTLLPSEVEVTVSWYAKMYCTVWKTCIDLHKFYKILSFHTQLKTIMVKF